METIAIAELKAHLSAELKKVQAGQTLIILDHKKPVAQLAPLPATLRMSRKALHKPEYRAKEALMNKDPLALLEAERADSW